MSTPTGALTPHQLQAAVRAAWEAGFFKGPHKRESYEGYERRPISLRKRFQDLTGIWPDDLVEWWTDDACPQIKGVRHGYGDESHYFAKIAEKCWELFVQSIGEPVVNWEEA